MFKNYCTKEREARRLLLRDAEEVSKSTAHTRFVEETLPIFRRNIFEIEKDESPYFDTGLIIKSPMIEHHYGFISRTAKTLFGATCFKKMGIYGYIDLHPGMGKEFEAQVTNNILLNGVVLTGLTRYADGGRKVVPDIPCPAFEYELDFAYQKAEKEKKSTIGMKAADRLKQETLKLVTFYNEEELEDFKTWADQSSPYSESAILRSLVGGKEMPVFDVVSIIKDVRLTGDVHTVFFPTQMSLEDHTKLDIRQSRFDSFVVNGRKFMEDLVGMIRPGCKVTCKENPKQYKIKYEDDTTVSDIHIHILYLGMKDSCQATVSQPHHFDVCTLPQSSMESLFHIKWHDV